MPKSMKRHWLLITCVLLAVAQSACFDRESKEQSVHPYDELADAGQDIENALAGLKDQQRLLLVFGANWCPDCRRVDASMVQPEITDYLTDHFAVVKVDVGNFDLNMDIAERYGSPTKKGIPAMAIVDRGNRTTRVVLGRELAHEHKKGREAFYRWIKNL
jgi:protein disulfide-isomerase